ncbi:MAG: hypothetical protein LUD51_07450 [Clostridia bacterium]|nr:hypothetical protein [Clostridia bacterium]
MENRNNDANGNQRLADEIMDCCADMTELLARMMKLASRLRRMNSQPAAESEPAPLAKPEQDKALGAYYAPVLDLLEDYSVLMEHNPDLMWHYKTGLKGLLESPEFQYSKPGALTFALGTDENGKAVCPDITRMPHLLIAGASGSGAGQVIDNFIISLLYRYTPEELRLLLIDPGETDFGMYKGLPNLLIPEIVSDEARIGNALTCACREMDRRYSLFSRKTGDGVAVRNLDEYNFNLASGEDELPKIVIICSEFTRFSDTMLDRIKRLCERGRAAGIHLVINVLYNISSLPDVIQDSMSSRICLKVRTQEDSVAVLGTAGAENLAGFSDMLFKSADSEKPVRVQGCWISSEDVKKVTDYIRTGNDAWYDKRIADYINFPDDKCRRVLPDDPEDSADEQYLKALHYCIKCGMVSVSMIQRRYPIGYMKACRMVDWMTAKGYITPRDGTKPQRVLMTMKEFIETYGDMDD